MALKEWKETTRDRLFLLLAFLLPALWLVVFGYGLNLDVEDIPFAVVDRDQSEFSREYLQRFIQSRYFSFRGYAHDEHTLDRLLTETKIRAAIIVPERFQEQLVAGEPVAVQTLLDGTFPLHTDIAKGYVIAINQAFTEDRLLDFLRRSRGLTREQAGVLVRPLSVEVRYLYNEEVRSTWSMVPALVMFTLMLASPLLTALGVVREKETGSIYNIYSSTVSRAEFLTGKLLPYILISLVNVCVLWLMAVGLFQVPFKGHFLLFFFAFGALRLLYHGNRPADFAAGADANGGVDHHDGRGHDPDHFVFRPAGSRRLLNTGGESPGPSLPGHVLHQYCARQFSERCRRRGSVGGSAGAGHLCRRDGRAHVSPLYQAAESMRGMV
ncbi:MAG: ABC transporter permease [Nitrospira sp.]